MKMHKILALIMAILVTLSACGQTEQDKKFDELTASRSSTPVEESQPPESEVSEPEEADTSVSGELVISAWARLGNPSALEMLADEFMELHPGVKITVDYAEGSAAAVQDVIQSRNSYCARVRAEIVSGEADYILYSPPGALNLYDISRSGVLTDLRPYWDNDPSIDPDDYFASILDAVSVDGKLTTMPFSVNFDGMYLNRAVLESIGVDPASITSVNSALLLDWYEKAREIDPEVKLFFSEEGKDFLFDYEKTIYFDMEERTAHFDSPEFLQFLERTNAVDDARPELSEMENFRGQDSYVVNELLRCLATGEETVLTEEGDPYAYGYVTKGGRSALACVTNMNMVTLKDVGFEMEYLAGPYPMTDTQGRLAISSIDDFAIPASMKNPELAWKFIAYCLRERESCLLISDYGPAMFYSQNAPLNKNNFSVLLQEMATGGAHGRLANKEGYKTDGDLVLAKMGEYLSGDLVNRKLYAVDVAEYLKEYYDNGLTTAEQCAEKIQGRAYIWLNE